MNINLNSIYKHYKGSYYKVLCLAISESNKEQLVVYQSLSDEDNEFGNHPIWARSVSEFEELYDGVNPRFEFICNLGGSDGNKSICL